MRMKVAGAALNQTPLDWEGNKRHILEAISQARDQQVDILCLPELCITGYGCEDLFLSNWLPIKAEQMLLAIVPHCQNITVAIGLPVKIAGTNYNTTCVVKDATILGFYAKQNMALDGVHYEPRWFTPWPSEVLTNYTIAGTSYPFGHFTFELNGIHIGFEICEDAWRNQRPACVYQHADISLILNPSASHFAFGKTHLREKLVVDSSENFNCTYVYANLLGNEAGRMIYDGEILIAKHGKLVKRNELLSFQDVNLVTSDIDFSTTATTEVASTYPHDKHEEFVMAEALALFDYMRKSRSRGFTLSLSGGADSSTCAVLVAEMVKRGMEQLGMEEFNKKLSTTGHSAKDIITDILTCAYQGTKNSSNDTLQSARELAQEIGATFYRWNIDEEVRSYTSKVEKVLARDLTWETDDIALQNIQARARSPIIWMIANIKNQLLITTSNRSEGDVGYATMDGDTSGSIAPISAVDKHFIIQWLQWAEKALGYTSLRYVNSLAPSAELRPLEKSQTDEADLMPYHIIVEIEKLAIRDHKSPLEVYNILQQKQLEDDELLKSHIKKFYRLWSRNQWKRERIAPAFHLDDFNVDPRTWCRFPILSYGFEEELKEL